MRFDRRALRIFVASLSTALALPAAAQTTGGITGKLVDASSSAPVADAVVIATSPSLQGEQTVVSDSTGSFELVLLPAGVYQIIVQREGYQPFTQSGLTIRLDSTIRVRLSLVPDSLQGQAVEIIAQRPTISVTSSQTGGIVSKEQMNLVPYGRNNRNFDAVLTSIPGVANDNLGFQLNGAQSLESSYIIDGVNVSDPAFSTQGTSLLQDFIQEVEVKSGGYQAEYGRSAGGIINAVTKSGGNDFHGSIFAYYTPFEASRKTVGAASAIARKDSLRYNADFGAELGGPILRDKLWFYVGFAPQFESLNVDRIVQARRDAGTGLPVLGSNGLPVFDPVATKRYTDTTTRYHYTAKLTYLLNENHSLAVHAFGAPQKRSGVLSSLVPQVSDINGSEGRFLGERTGGGIDAALSYSGKLFNKQMLVESSLYYHRSTSSTTPLGLNGFSSAALLATPSVTYGGTRSILDPVFQDGTTPDYQTQQAVLAACTLKANGFDPCPVSSYSTGGLGFLRSQTVYRIGGVLKLSNFVEAAGHHQFKYGIDVGQDHYDLAKQYSGNAAWNATGANFVVSRHYGIADPSNPTQPARDGNGQFLALNPSTSTKNNTIAVFVQDTWNVLDKIVLDVGVRYEKQIMYQDTSRAVYDQNLQPYSGAPINLNNFMPRVGLIYDFTGRGLSKVYGSFGRFYEYIPLDLADRTLSGEKRVNYATDQFNCTASTSLLAVDPRNCAVKQGFFSNNRTYTFTGAGFGNLVDSRLKGQYNDEFQGGAHYQFYRDISIGVDYVHKQVGQIVEDMSNNDGNSYFLANPGVAGTLGYSATTGKGVVVLEPPPVRRYDAITLSLTKNLSENYFVTASYTYSRLRGNYPGLFRPENNQIDPNLTSEYDLASSLANKNGPLPTDIPNSFKVDGAYIYDLNAKTQITLGGSVRVDQGTPLSVLARNPDRPSYGPTESFVLPRGADGRLPWQYSISLRAAASRRLSESYVLSLSVDLQNVTNYQPAITRDQSYSVDLAGVAPITNGTLADLAGARDGNGQPVNVNPLFRTATAYALPFSLRAGARLSF
jgi:outer membrane receptor protein involved in Fe transport